MSPLERMTIDKIHALPADLQQQILAFAEFVELRDKSNRSVRNINRSPNLIAVSY